MPTLTSRFFICFTFKSFVSLGIVGFIRKQLREMKMLILELVVTTGYAEEHN